MRSLDEIARGFDRGALVFIRQPDDGFDVRPAAFVFPTATGFAWVEPAYADPAGTPSPALHYRDGAIEEVPGGFRCGDCEVVAAPEDAADTIGDALAWFEGYLQASGRTWDDERERVRAAIESA